MFWNFITDVPISLRVFFICLLNMNSELMFFNFGEFSYISSLISSSILFPWVCISGICVKWLVDLLDCTLVFIFSISILFSFVLHILRVPWVCISSLLSNLLIWQTYLKCVKAFSCVAFILFIGPCLALIDGYHLESQSGRPSLSTHIDQPPSPLVPLLPWLSVLQDLRTFCLLFLSLPFSLLFSLKYLRDNSFMLIRQVVWYSHVTQRDPWKS